MKRATIKDVARTAGVSVATVSRALAGSSAVRPETTERVLQVVRDLSYIPHSGARSLVTNRTDTIGVLLPDIHGEFFSELIRGLDRASRTSGYQLLVSGFHSNRREVEAVVRATSGRVDGLILMTPDIAAASLRSSLLEGVPVVLLNCSLDSGDLDTLEVDSFGGAAAVVRHFAALGHHRIAMVKGPSGNHDAQERLRGYRAAIAELGLESSSELELAGDFSEEAGRRAAAQVLAMGDPPTAVLAANDAMAIGLLCALREAHVAIPGELAISGFDDIPAARWVSPTLTSVQVDIAELGARAMACLLDAISKPTHRPVHDVLPAQLVVRESCGAHLCREDTPRKAATRPTPVFIKSSRGGGHNEQQE